MRRVIVFDTGWGGELLADRLEEVLPGEVVRVIPWRDGILEEERSASAIRRLTEQRLAGGGFLGTKDIIVLAEPGVALAAKDYLKRKYPEQVFIGGLMGVKPRRKMMVLATPGLKSREEYQIWKAEAEEVTEPECKGWAEKIYDGELKDEEVTRAVKGFQDGTVMILSTNFIDVRKVIERATWRRAKVVDLSKEIVRETCAELGLRGKDGEVAQKFLGYENYSRNNGQK